jgi:hypothetical protein
MKKRAFEQISLELRGPHAYISGLIEELIGPDTPGSPLLRLAKVALSPNNSVFAYS